MPFSKLGLSKTVLEGEGHGLDRPFSHSISDSVAVEGKDVIGSAQTGTGKRALADPSQLPKPDGTSRVLILEPTRELASQVETAIP